MDKTVLIQKQIRDNADEIHCFMRDLNNWEQEMKRKETVTDSESTLNIPPIRKKTKTTSVSSNNETAKSSIVSEAKPKKISAYDYGAWDKLDVDKICDELDKGESSTSKTIKKEINVVKEPSKQEAKVREIETAAGSPQRDTNQFVKKNGSNIVKGSRKNWKSSPEYQNQPPIRDHESFKDDFWRDKPEEQVRTRANYFKELGNDLVAEENWKDAIQMYSNAIRLYPLDPVFYANRALCHLKLKELKEAEHDCDTAIQINNKYVKAYLRRATALQLQEKYMLAKEDFLTVLQHEPSNSFAKEGLKKVDLSLKTSQNHSSSIPKLEEPKVQELQKSEVHKVSKSEDRKDVKAASSITNTWLDEKDDIKVIKGAIVKPAHLQSIKPLKSVPIKRIHNDYVSPLTTAGKDELFKHVLRPVKKEIEPLITDVKQIDSSKVPETLKEDVKSRSMSTDIPQVNQSKVSDILKRIDQKSSSTSKDTPKIYGSEAESSKKECVIDENLSNICVPRTPSTYVGFSNAWAALENDPVKRYLYLKQIDNVAEKFPKICGDSLENEVLSEIIDVLVKEFVKRNEGIYQYLLALTLVRRFRALILFLPEVDKKALTKAVDYCVSRSECSNEEAVALSKKFEL